MSNYPDGMPSSGGRTVHFNCNCGASWDAEAVYDLGMIDLVDDNDERCPACGEWQ